MLIEQAVAMTPPVIDHAKEVYALAGLAVTQAGAVLAIMVNGRKRTRHAGVDMDRRFGDLRGDMRQIAAALQADVGECRSEIRDLKAHVIGPDGQNGLRGEVREIKDDVRGLLSRERGRRA